ncbi:hypothetical protein FE783_12670 [Paenibacillus mesophilus]|uniref:phage neck terminator protein n=1 Tax=Paenibacillus mesophilus TaxID=2582849 RepID=UPI00110D7C15|nr:hypothetical protein [Paenibacillus mesophilus]TMV49363.1 hypothetical protein FE783_12670 [Paenibacillus mesophilus]
MLELATIRNTIIAGLYTKLARPVIRADGDGDVPDYPYVAYSITSPYIDSYGHDAERWFNVPGGIGVELIKHIECALSFSCYAEDEDAAQALCLRIIEHFSREARDDLRETGIVVVGVSGVQNRSVLLVEHYERRWGVDVRFRVIDRSEIIDATGGYIETAEITNEGG